LAGRLRPFSGAITRADKLVIAYFAQHQLDELSEEASPYDHVRRLMPDAPESKVRGRAGAIGFSGKAADTPVKSLSGGEKARLLLGLATFYGPNMIILDEPTNHLDIDSRAALAEAINEFPGAVIMVSHDRYLIEACADRLWRGAGRSGGPQFGGRPRRLPPHRTLDALRAGRGTRPQPDQTGPGAQAGQWPERLARFPEAEDLGCRGRDRAHQRYHRQDRYGAC